MEDLDATSLGFELREERIVKVMSSHGSAGCFILCSVDSEGVTDLFRTAVGLFPPSNPKRPYSEVLGTSSDLVVLALVLLTPWQESLKIILEYLECKHHQSWRSNRDLHQRSPGLFPSWFIHGNSKNGVHTEDHGRD